MLEPNYRCGASLACPGGSNHGQGFAIDVCLKDPTGKTVSGCERARVSWLHAMGVSERTAADFSASLCVHRCPLFRL